MPEETESRGTGSLLRVWCGRSALFKGLVALQPESLSPCRARELQAARLVDRLPRPPTLHGGFNLLLRAAYGRGSVRLLPMSIWNT